MSNMQRSGLKRFLLGYVVLALTLVITASAPSAQTADELQLFPNPDVVACVRAVSVLDQRYRTHMQIECMGAASLFCVPNDEVDPTCFAELNNHIFAFYSEIKPQLPQRIDEPEWSQRRYLAALERVQTTFDGRNHDCTVFEQHGQEFCEFMYFTLVPGGLQDLLFLASRAGLRLSE